MKEETIKVYATQHEVRLIGRFLAGELKEGSAENLTARRALARLLRNPEQQLDLGLRWALAELFDPDPPLAYSHNGPIRLARSDECPLIIHLKRRRRGRPERDAVTEKEIAEFICATRSIGKWSL
jgi:hypothetical protein